MEDTWLSSVLLLLYRALEERGLDAAAVAREAGLSLPDLLDEDRRIPNDAASRFWAAADEAVGRDPCLGLDVARQLHPTTLHAVGYAWLASSNLAEAALRLRRFYRILSAAEAPPRSRRDAGLCWLIFDHADDAPVTGYDARVVSVLMLARAVMGDDFCPAAVRLRHPRRPGIERLEAFLGVVPEYESDEYAIAVRDDDLTRSLGTGNAALARAADETAVAYLGRHDTADIVSQVRTLMIELMPLGELKRDAVAQRLAISARTLQRRLSDRGYTFAALSDEVRHELARDYLRNERHSVQEVAWRLGFAELASFTKAFKRWTGLSPSAWRTAETPAAAAAALSA